MSVRQNSKACSLQRKGPISRRISRRPFSNASILVLPGRGKLFALIHLFRPNEHGPSRDASKSSDHLFPTTEPVPGEKLQVRIICKQADVQICGHLRRGKQDSPVYRSLLSLMYYCLGTGSISAVLPRQDVDVSPECYDDKGHFGEGVLEGFNRKVCIDSGTRFVPSLPIYPCLSRLS